MGAVLRVAWRSASKDQGVYFLDLRTVSGVACWHGGSGAGTAEAARLCLSVVPVLGLHVPTLGHQRRVRGRLASHC